MTLGDATCNISALAPDDDQGIVPNRLYSTREVCVFLNCSRQTVTRLVSRGLLVPVQYMGHNRFQGEDIVQLVVSRTHDDATIIRGALALLSETHAEEDRPLCPSCTKRRVNRGHSMCTRCEEQHELQLSHKRKWWDAHGADRRKAQRQQEAAEAGVPAGDEASESMSDA